MITMTKSHYYVGNDDDDDDQTLEKISVDFTEGHLWSIIMPYLGVQAMSVIACFDLLLPPNFVDTKQVETKKDKKGTTVVYFDQPTGTPHAIHWSQ